MKKIAFLLLAMLPFISCEDTETNDVALQAKINDRLYQSTDVSASIGEGGRLVIQGSNVDESITLSLARLREGSFLIDNNNSNKAVFSDVYGNSFSTVFGGQGTVHISEIDELHGTLTGTFNFSAVLPGVDTVYVSRGVLYRVPFGGQNIPGVGNSTFKAKIDGQAFSALLVTSYLNGDIIGISGSTPDAGISIMVPGSVEPGEYGLTDFDFTLIYQDFNPHEETLDGAINIQAHNPQTKTIKGTFWFNTASHEITEGEFEVQYETLFP